MASIHGSQGELAPIIGAAAADDCITPPSSRDRELSSTRRRAPKQDQSAEAALQALTKSQGGSTCSTVLSAALVATFLLVLVYVLSRGGGGQGLRGSSEAGSYYSVVIDAGSTGSRVHVFRFNQGTGELQDVNGEPSLFKQNKPGMSTCAGNRTCLTEHLTPLLAAAADAVPVEQRVATPIALRATAGLRMLPGDQAEVLLQGARDLIRSYNFIDAGVSVMAGSDEGTFQWVALNFLFEALGPSKTPAAVIDLGGGSVQMAYTLDKNAIVEVSEQRRKEYIREIHLPGQKATAYLYQHSYLGYGLMAARAKMLAEAEAAGIKNSNPCLLKGAEVEYSYNGKSYSGNVGAGDAANCSLLVERMLHKELPCGDAPQASDRCSFNGVWAGPGFSRTIASSFLFDRLQDAGVIEDGVAQVVATPATYVAEAAKACGKDPAEAQWMCFDLSFAAGLLHQGFGIGMDQQVDVVKQIVHRGRRYEATWALGVALDRPPNRGPGAPAPPSGGRGE